MAENAVDVVDLGNTVPDFSLWGMFAQADWIVQLVMLLLFGASLGCWAIIYDKSLRVRRITAQADRFDAEFWSGNSLEDFYDRIKKNPDHPMAALFVAAMREWQRSATGRNGSQISMGLQDRIYRVMRVTVSREMERLESYLNFLATVGSTAPFVGLFGTVWGIMNAFENIAMTHNSSLAVVAPGIAEALFATAMGLVAAIPAVVAYNKISNDLGRYANRLEGFADEFGTILSRQLDEEHH
ncbi:protein TolQ [Paremcibacter congregatus]|uniref:Tol-Pal system protein TolQ n=1 Tax=Paremcibacter congregatus TaxID=2043170 RepID=A0A2G4YTT7_9PROT|nr:protein TolQ [Paremcibacter congregatus]PHZ85751.1 protein TolQ [Paremcibacter congregatus]QDE26713.1 protein TolQ [Paremcibacter congregatus]